MDTLIVYLDDAAYAQHILIPVLAPEIATRCVMVACAPRMSRRIGKWLSHTTREHWRNKWCDKLFTEMNATLAAHDVHSRWSMEYCIAQGPLPELTQRLRSRYGIARVVDARRPKFGQVMAPVVAGQPTDPARWHVPSAVASLGAVMALAAD
jgi:hypothetical protein